MSLKPILCLSLPLLLFCYYVTVSLNPILCLSLHLLLFLFLCYCVFKTHIMSFPSFVTIFVTLLLCLPPLLCLLPFGEAGRGFTLLSLLLLFLLLCYCVFPPSLAKPLLLFLLFCYCVFNPTLTPLVKSLENFEVF